MASFTDNVELKKQGFIYEATEATSESMADLPKNRSMLLAELTDQPPAKPEVVHELETMDDVFKHYKPKVKVEFNDANGASINEALEFHNVGDFGKKALIKQSNFLRQTDQKKEDFQSFGKKIQHNKVLQKVLSNEKKKKAYITLLKTMLNELEGNG